MAKVVLDGVDKLYSNTQALSNVSMVIEHGEFAVFVGPSGCGKSTLLRSIAGLESINAGRIEIDGQNVTRTAPSDRDVAMVFQTYALYPHMSVQQNMEFGMKVNGVASAQRIERVNEAARILQLQDYLDRKPAQLSGGQRQRVAIGRAIVKNPKVFLFDEPLSNLDAKLRIQMRIELEALHRQLGATMIYVTHDQVEAMTMADKIVVLNQGVIEQVGPPMELYHSPRTRFVADFLGSPGMNFMPAEVSENALMIAGSKICSYSNDRDVRLMGIRPEHIQVQEPGTGTLDVDISVKESLGDESFLYVMHEPSNTRLTVKTHGEDSHAPGQTIALRFPVERIHLFDASDEALTAPEPA